MARSKPYVDTKGLLFVVMFEILITEGLTMTFMITTAKMSVDLQFGSFPF